MEKKKSWFKINKINGIIILIVLVIIVIAFFGNSSNEEVSKKKEYSINNCLYICKETYNIQTQIDICQGNCYSIGNPGSSMDKYVNTVKDIRDKNFGGD